jgi:3-phenylpropionate/trans-cinnamate dioxygenase ferredoxin component
MNYLFGPSENLVDGHKKRFLAGETALMLARVDGQLFAIEDTCTHNKASLSSGKMEGYSVQCPWHGAKFDIRTGQVLVLPAAVPVKTFKIWEENNQIWVQL